MLALEHWGPSAAICTAGCDEELMEPIKWHTCLFRAPGDPKPSRAGTSTDPSQEGARSLFQLPGCSLCSLHPAGSQAPYSQSSDGIEISLLNLRPFCV